MASDSIEQKPKIQIYATPNNEVTPFWKAKYEKDAKKYWDVFYKRHQDRFFKDRHYLDKEWGHYFSEGEEKVILEVGCGAGNTIFPLAATYPGIFIHACDFSPRAVDLVKAHKDFEETKINAFACDLTSDELVNHIPPSSVDIVTMIFVLSAVSPEKMPLVLQNIKKILKPNGYVLFRDYATGDLAQERLTCKDQKISDNFFVRGDGTRAFYFSEEFLKTLFQENGFTIKECGVCCKQVENRSREIVMNRRWVQAVFRLDGDIVEMHKMSKDTEDGFEMDISEGFAFEMFGSSSPRDEDQPIDVDTAECGDNKRKRKAPSKPWKTTSECWKYFEAKFEPDENGDVIKMAYCKWCEAVFKADSFRHGTRALNNHYVMCDNNPDVEKLRKQKKLAFKKKIGENDEGVSSLGTLETWKYDEKVIKKSLIELIVLAELPFKFVEHPAFIKFSTNMQPRFNMPSRFTIARDVSKFYIDERKSLLNFLSNKATTVHLTTDTWTSSCKRMNFMVLTAHFIDDDWVMHKRIINFRPIHSHRGVDIGRALLECINGWGIKNVMTITVDNIASNDKALEYLVENLPTKYDGGKHFHIRCMAHILNLVVKDGLKTFNKEVNTIALAVKYIKHSSQRVTNFKESVENACTSNKFLVSECPTRWNSTHDMLKTAIELKEAFFDFDFNNSCFARDLEEIPKRVDFEVCKKVVAFLEKFKETTELVSNVSCPIAHLWFGEVLDIDKYLREWQDNASFKVMIEEMRKKYEKYLGDYKKINHYMYFANILDPTMKSEIIRYGFRHLIENGCIPMEVDEESDETPMSFLTDEELCDKLVKKVEKDMGVLFAMYKEKYGTHISNDIPKPTSSQSSNTSRRRGNSFLNAVKDKLGNKLSGGEDELTKYLKEPRLELENDEDFDILNWWKVNSPRFPIVSRMAKDILCIQVSTVASESAFSISGRVLDPYRNSLAPNIIEALVCTQDWIRTSSKNITMDTFEDLMKDDELVKEIQEALDKQKGEHGKENNFAP